MNKKKLFVFVIMSVLLVARAGAAEKSNWAVGVNSGWSFGLGKVFQPFYNSAHYDENYDPVAHLGVYASAGISRSFAVRMQMTFQGIVHRWTFSHFNEPTSSGTDLMPFCSLTLDGVLGSRSGEGTRLFFQGGGGLCYGGWDHFQIWYFTLQGGPGIRFPLKKGNRSAILVSATLQHLLGQGRYGGNRSVDFVRAAFGYEVAVPGSGD